MLNIPVLLPLAALDNIISVVVPLLFLLFWVLGQMGEAKKKATAKAEARRRHRQPVPTGQDAQLPKRAGPAHADQADPLRQQVEVMLRDAGFGAGEVPAAPPTGRGSAGRDPTIEVLIDEDPAAVEVVPVGLARRKEDSRLSRPDRGELVSPAARSIQRESLTERASQLGDDIVLAEGKFESSTREKFAHEVGTLKDTHSEDVYKQRSNENLVAARLASLLTNPEGVREAIILGEILNRPVDRW